jgi:hypothetical protein
MDTQIVLLVPSRARTSAARLAPKKNPLMALERADSET